MSCNLPNNLPVCSTNSIFLIVYLTRCYSFLHSDSEKKSGGVGIYIDSSISYQIQTDIPNALNASESLWIEINLHKKPCIIGVIYRHPGYDISAFAENICEILHNLSDKKLPFIICGDININLMQQTAIPQVRKYVNVYKSYNCSQLITKPTRITPSSSTLIDHIYITLPLYKVTPGILINGLSDHLPIFVSIKSAHVEKVDTKAQFKHDFSNFNAEQFMDEIKETLNGMIIKSNNPAAALDDAIRAIKKVLDDHAPWKKCLELKGD